MKKVIGKISWMMAIMGVLLIVLTMSIVDSFILFYIGIGLLVISIVCALFTGEKTKEAIFRLLDFV